MTFLEGLIDQQQHLQHLKPDCETPASYIYLSIFLVFCNVRIYFREQYL